MSKFRVPETGGNYYILKTSVIATHDGEFELLTGTVKPCNIIVNATNTDLKSTSINLKKGANTLVLAFDKACETYFIFRDPQVSRSEREPVTMRWHGDNGVLPLDCNVSSKTVGLFSFKSAPALRSLTFKAYGNIQIRLNGKEEELARVKKLPDGLTDYKLSVKNPVTGISDVLIIIEYQPGYRGAAAIPEYIEQECGNGLITIGDWSEIDGLRAYSGGAWYRKTINIEAKDLAEGIEIDLGHIISSAELFINGYSAGIRLSPPWTYDITERVKAGENRIEVLVYNTLANNYTSIPTRYRGDIKSGLIGPVSIILSGK
jgi:hypothetical protein